MSADPRGLASTRVDKRAERTADSQAGDVGPQLVDGVLMPHETVAELVKCLDLLALLAKQKGASLPAGLSSLRTQLASVTTRVTTRAASEKVTAVLEFAHADLGLVATAAAAKTLGIKEDSVRDLCRRNRLERLRINGRYWISEQSILAYQSERKGA